MACIFQDSHQSQVVEFPEMFPVFLMISTSPSIGNKAGRPEHCASSGCEKMVPVLKSIASPSKSTSVKFYDALSKWVFMVILAKLMLSDLTCN